MRICVLGAGIAGLSTAYELQRRGHGVVVVDAATWPGAGASAGNGAQLSYAYVQPLADPGLWRQLPSLLLSRDSPASLRPRLDVQQWRWLLSFLAACRAGVSHETTRLLLATAARSRAGFDAMLADLAPDCDFGASGKLVLASTAASFEAMRRQVELQRSLGCEQRLVDADGCVAIEPSLAQYGSHIAGGVFTPGECAADCRKVCEALAAALAKRGAQVKFGTRVGGPARVSAGTLHALQTSDGPLEADAFVCALGTASSALACEFGARLPLYPLKGYSLTLDTASVGIHDAPRVSVTDSARKVVFARLGNRLRVAGIADIDGDDVSIVPRRIESLRIATRAVFPGCADACELQQWAGLRPATPTGRPIVGRLPGLPRNLLFNTGLGALGFTLAFGTAAAIAHTLESQPR